MPPQHLGCGEARRATTDDHNPVGFAVLGAPPYLSLSALLAYEDLAVALLDPPRVDWTEGRRAQGFAGAKIEAGVVPRASHPSVDDEAVRQRSAIVGAVSADREHVGPAAHEQDCLLSRMTDQLAAVGQFGEGNPLR